jgi:major type 1 subunit fimbrin (pilin)
MAPSPHQINNLQSTINNPQSAIRNPQSAIRNPQSAIRNYSPIPLSAYRAETV